MTMKSWQLSLLLLLLPLLPLARSTPSVSTANPHRSRRRAQSSQAPPRLGALLNARRAPLSALSAPRHHYFLEFPLPDDDSVADGSANATTAGDPAVPRPRCEDGSAHGFLFRRGTNAHLNKLLVEFGGASGRTAAPWGDWQARWRAGDNYVAAGGGALEMPSLRSCTGFSPGFVEAGADLVGLGGEDVPIFLRGLEDGGDDENGGTERSEGNLEARKAWWEHLGGDGSDPRDWSYLFVPHCTPSSPSATDTNVRAVSDWITSNFEDAGGLDALVAVSGGGRIGGCPSNVSTESGLAAALFAKNVASSLDFGSTKSKALVVVDGATLWNAVGGGLGLEEAMRGVLVPEGNIEVAWVASKKSESDDSVSSWVEDQVLKEMGREFGNSFHVFRPPSPPAEVGTDQTDLLTCSLYAFPDESSDDGFASFLDGIIEDMPWGNLGAHKQAIKSTEDYNTRLSFLSIFLILLGLYLSSWAVYILVKRRREQRSEDSVTRSPHDLWFLALTNYPVIFLLCSVALPVILSLVVYAREGSEIYILNFDFDSYLDIDTKEERVMMQYKTLLSYQMDSLEEEEQNCGLLYGGDSEVLEQKMRRALWDEEDAYEQEGHPWRDHQHDDPRHRKLQYGNPNGRTVITFFYQNRRGGDVFTPETIQSIRDFEEFLVSVPGFDDFCFRRGGKECYPIDSVVPYFYPGLGGKTGTTLVGDIEGVLRSLTGSKDIVAKMDKYYSKENPGSNVTLTNVMLNDIGGSNSANVQRFLESLHQELWRVDHDRKYPDLIISWSNDYMQDVEAADALEHDFRWSLAALTFIGLMVYVKVRNVFLVLAGVLGLVLSFTSALYWQYHFNFDQLTAMHVAGLYVMLGIGADDIFLTIDSYEHTKVDFAGLVTGTEEVPKFDDPEIIKLRMISSYKTAGSMLLVSSVTTAICFFSNIFSALVSISDFGSYMGMVVVLNYIHVMTILPSAMIVNEFHIKPFTRRMWEALQALRSKPNNEGEGMRDPNNAISIYDEGEDGSPSSSSCSDDGHVGSVTLDDDDVEFGGNFSDRDGTSPETVASASEDTTHENEEAEQISNNDYKFLSHTLEMTALDRYFVQRHAPFVHKWRKVIVSVSLFMSLLLGILAWLNFKLYDGTIIIFKEKYNLGRVQQIVDEYFPDELVRRYAEGGLDFNASDFAGATGNSFGASDVDGVDIIVDAGFGAGYDGGGSAANSDPTATAPMASLVTSSKSPSSTPTESPSSTPTESPSSTLAVSKEQNTTDTLPTTPTIVRPVDIDGYIDAYECDGVGFNSVSSDFLPTTEIAVCIKAKFSDAELYLNRMVLTQGETELSLVHNGVISFPSFTSLEYLKDQNGVAVMTLIPENMFNFTTEIKITGGAAVNADEFDAREEASFELIINSQQEIPPQDSSEQITPPITLPTSSVGQPMISLSSKPTASPTPVTLGIDSITSSSTGSEQITSPIALPTSSVGQPMISLSSKPTASPTPLNLGIDGTTSSSPTATKIESPTSGIANGSITDERPTLGIYTTTSSSPTVTKIGSPASAPSDPPVSHDIFCQYSKCKMVESTVFNCLPGDSGCNCTSGQSAGRTCTKKVEEEKCTDVVVVPWDSATSYSARDVVRVGTMRFMCREWPNSLWCSSYKPELEGDGLWNNAWIVYGVCDASPTTSPTNNPSDSPIDSFRNPSLSPTGIGRNTISPFVDPSLSPTPYADAEDGLTLGTDDTISPLSNPSSPPTRKPTLSPKMSILETKPAPSPATTPIAPFPTLRPTKLSDVLAQVSIPPSPKPTRFVPEFNCPPGLPCLQTNGDTKAFKKREFYAAAIVWGMRPISEDPDVWVVKDTANKRKNEALDDTLNENYIDPSEPYIQEWLLKLVGLARNDAALRLHPQLTWIEILKEFATTNGLEFPLPQNLFIGLVEMLKERNDSFRNIVWSEIGTRNPGIQGEVLFTGITVLSEVPPPDEDITRSEAALRDWTNFTHSINEILPDDLPSVSAQSNVFTDSYRMSVIVESTVSSYFFSNGMILMVVLLFVGNLSLTLMVVSSLILILLCFGGLILFVFQIEFGPVESLGVSIFVGLCANYLLHIVHSYHKSNIKDRNVKIQRALFVTGSPILWSAISTIGGSVFLFACRTWLLTELGILICTIIALSLTFSVGYLLALLALIGPLPVKSYDNERHILHSCDLMFIFKSCSLRKDAPTEKL